MISNKKFVHYKVIDHVDYYNFRFDYVNIQSQMQILKFNF